MRETSPQCHRSPESHTCSRQTQKSTSPALIKARGEKGLPAHMKLHWERLATNDFPRASKRKSSRRKECAVAVNYYCVCVCLCLLQKKNWTYTNIQHVASGLNINLYLNYVRNSVITSSLPVCTCAFQCPVGLPRRKSYYWSSLTISQRLNFG